MSHHPIREAMDRIDASPSAEFLTALRRDVLADFTGARHELMVLDVEPGEEQLVDVQESNRQRRPRRARKFVLAAAALITVFAAAAVVTIRPRDPAETPTELHVVDPDEALPMASRAVINPHDLGALWDTGALWPDAATYLRLVHDTQQAVPECAVMPDFGLVPPTDRSVTAQQNFYSGDKWMFHQVMVFASADDASRAMDVIAGQVYPQCLFDLIDRIIPLGQRMNATTKSVAWQAPPVKTHGDRQVSFGQLVHYTVTSGNVDIYLVNVFVQVGRSIGWVDPQYFPESTTPLYRVDKAVDANAAALEAVFGG